MAKKRIELKLTLELETGDAEIIDITVDGSAMSSAQPQLVTNGVSAAVKRVIEEFAPASTASFEMDFAERCVSDLGLDLHLPLSERKYVNVYPPKRYGAKRAACFDVRSGRLDIFCRPENAKGRQHTQVVRHNDEPVAVKVYLRSEAEVDEAIQMTRIGLDERN